MNTAQTKTGSLRQATLVLALAGVAAAAAASLWFVLHAAWADAGTLAARNTVTGWRDGSGPTATPESWERTRTRLLAGLDTTPNNAQLHDDLGYLYAARSQGLGTTPPDSPEHSLQQNLMDQAITHYRLACALRPTFPYTWAYLALAKHYRGIHDPEFWTALDRALQYGRNEAALQPTLGEMAFDLWPKLGAQRQQTIATMVATAKQAPQANLHAMAQRAGVELPPR